MSDIEGSKYRVLKTDDPGVLEEWLNTHSELGYGLITLISKSSEVKIWAIMVQDPEGEDDCWHNIYVSQN